MAYGIHLTASEGSRAGPSPARLERLDYADDQKRVHHNGS